MVGPQSAAVRASFLLGPLAFTFALGGVACSDRAEDRSEPNVATSDAQLVRKPTKLTHLPDLGDLTADCGAFTLQSKTVDPYVQAKKIYDAYFAARRPQAIEDFGFHPEPIEPLVDTIRFPTMPKGLKKERYQELAGLRQKTGDVERNATRPNLTIFKELSLAPITPPVDTAYVSFNPYDETPGALTHYATNATRDIMATQFVFRSICEPYQMERALAACGDSCIDTMATMSKLDMFYTFEVRFVRSIGSGYEVSKPFRLASLDTSHDLEWHMTGGPGGQSSPQLHFDAPVAGTQRTALWRGEIGGQLAKQLGRWYKPTAVLIKALPESEYASADAPEPGSCSDLNDQETRCDAGRLEICRHARWLKVGARCPF